MIGDMRLSINTQAALKGVFAAQTCDIGHRSGSTNLIWVLESNWLRSDLLNTDQRKYNSSILLAIQMNSNERDEI